MKRSLPTGGVVTRAKKNGSPELVVSAAMTSVRSAIKQKGVNRDLSQLFRNSGYLKNNLHSAVFCAGSKFYIQQQL